MENRNPLFPVFLKLEQLELLLVGGGKIGHEKLLAILSNAPQTKVTVVAETVSQEVEELAARFPTVHIIRKKFEPADLEEKNPIYIADYKRIVDHIDHIKKVAGIDHAGLGSDYDGVPFLPSPMKGTEDLVLVTYEMLRRGYTDAEVRKVLGENFLRAFSQAEKIAGTRRISADGSLMKLKK